MATGIRARLVRIAFSGVLGLGRTWQREREEGALSALLVAPLASSALFAGKATPEDVIAAAQQAKGDDPMFYAHLYLGLYFEAIGDREKTREHIFKAARDFKAPHYMGDVARVHARLLEKQKS